MTVIVDYTANTSRSLERRAQPDEQITETDAADAPKLARLLTRILSEIAAIRRRFTPRRILFTNVPFDATGTLVFQFPHKFGGSVSWSIVGWRAAAFGHDIGESATTTKDVLALVSLEAGTGDVLVEERG